MNRRDSLKQPTGDGNGSSCRAAVRLSLQAAGRTGRG